jgi:F-type H+-transporting ATPase subunit alpha
MKKVAGTLKIDQAQYEELESFSKFSSDLDRVTAMALDKGRKNNELLIQPQYSPMPVGEQVAVLYCGTHALMSSLEVSQVRDFEKLFLERMRVSYPELLERLGSGEISREVEKIIEKEASEICSLLKTENS